MDKDNTNNEELKPLLTLYRKMSNELIYNIRDNGIDPTEVAIDSGISSEKMLELLVNSDKGDYLAYKELDDSVKRLSKRKEKTIEK